MSSNKNNNHDSGPKVSLTFLLLSTLFCVCLIISNLVEIKTVDLGWFTITAGVIVFPVSYIINDCVVEVYGFRKARLMIWMGFISALVVALMLQLAIILPGGKEWEHQDAMKQIYGSVPRIMFASFTAFLCGSMVNAYVMSKMKAADTKGRFSLRAILSSLWGESVDSLIFFPIAFAGTFPWPTIFSLIVTQALLKTGYEIIILPITIRLVKKLKKHEGDVIDKNISYNWWKLTDVD
ncbi:MAG: queuosine precursor transporter [Muribaculaceae bacterium]|nr:queuosine precursor transporter [Muribaculaceae bacterium]